MKNIFSIVTDNIFKIASKNFNDNQTFYEELWDAFNLQDKSNHSKRHDHFANSIPFIALVASSMDFENGSKSSSKNAVTKASNWLNKKILIVEDDDANYLFLEYVLKKTKANLVRAVDGIQAVNKCREDEGIDLIMMDIQLPIMDGYDATVEIRNFRKQIPIIAQTAYTMLTDREKCFECGCNEYITKPIDRVALIELLSKYLDK